MFPSSITPLVPESQAWLILSGLCGILLLLAGGTVIRLGVAITGLVLGTLMGWMIWAGLEIPVPSWLMMGLGAIVALCIAFLLARFLTALLMGLVLALWLVGLVLTWAAFDPQLETPLTPLPTIVASTVCLHQTDADVASNHSEDLDHVGILLHDALQETWGQLQITWSTLPQIYRLIIGFGAIAGLVLGLLLGLMLPRAALLLMTCGWGGLMLLVSAIGLANGVDQEGPWQSSVAMMLVWTAVSALGWALQRSFQGRQPSEST
ncbi:MAG: hypothetical protein VX527_11665 [Planctomycetota bacterium]|nr:hypothetical protein [Planctomycetota bacterium]